MAINDVVLGRLALSHIGAKATFESFAELTPEVVQVKLWYDFCRQQVLEAFDWDFARKRQVLATHVDAPPEGQWAYRYQYPADCIAPRFIENPVIPNPNTGIFPLGLYSSVLGAGADAVPFLVEQSSGTRSILTNLDEATLVYTFDFEDVSLYSPLSIEAFSHALASKIAMALTRNPQIRDSELRTFLALVRFAQAHNANQSRSEAPRDADWIRGRA